MTAGLIYKNWAICKEPLKLIILSYILVKIYIDNTMGNLQETKYNI